MQLFKPSHSYQSNFSKYEHQEHKSQSNYANYAWDNPTQPIYDCQTPDHFLGQSICDFDENESTNAMDNYSMNYHAQAHRALPSPSIQVQEDHHVLEKMKRQETHVGQEWARNSPRCSNLALRDNSRFTMHDKKHVMGEMEQGWASMPNSYSSPAQSHHFSESNYNEHEQEAYNYGESGIDGGYAHTPAMFSSPKHLNPIKTNQVSLINHKGEQMMGNMDHGWGNLSPKACSPTQAQHSRLAMHKEGHVMGKTDASSWPNSPNKFSSSTQSRQLDHSMHANKHMMEKNQPVLAYPPSKFSSSSQAHHTDMSMHRDGHVMGKMDHGWANSQSKFPRPTQTHYLSSNSVQSRDDWDGKSYNGLGRNHINNQSAHASYNGHGQCVDDDVHDIMDEILAKYPAHNVSGGNTSICAPKPNSIASRNMGVGYANRQASGGGLAQYGSATQAMASSKSNFDTSKQINAGYSSSAKKEEYSANSMKFETKSIMNKGGYY